MLTRGDKVLFVILAAVAVCAVAAFGTLFSFVVLSTDEHFGLTSTSLTLEEGEEESLTVWSLPSGSSYSDIEWTSSNPEAVTVSDGTVKGIVPGGESIITATVRNGNTTYTDECTVKVCESGTKVCTLRSDDAYSETMDYAVLSGTGFEEGYLSLTFNSAGYTVIGLAGYDPSWLSISKTFIGSATKDFDSATMKIVSNETVIHSENYKRNDDSGAYNLIIADDLPYGSYDVIFELSYSNGPFHSKTVSVNGHFEYMEGDGGRDASGTYCRTYAWKCDADDSGTVDSDESFTMKMTYDYADYWNAYCLNGTKVFEVNNTIHNAHYDSDIVSFCRIDSTVSNLCSRLTELYKANGNSTDDRQLYAQFLLTFLQISYGYEYDSTQYYDGASSTTVDYWAFPSETIFSGYGDCEDTSALCSTLYKSAGFDSCIFLLSDHAMSGVALEDYTDHGLNANLADAEDNGLIYYFCESTVYSPVMHAYRSITGTTTEYKLVYDKIQDVNCTYYLIGMVGTSMMGEEFTIYTI